MDTEEWIPIFTIADLQTTLGKASIELKQKNTEDDELQDNRNNRINLLGKGDVDLASNGCKTRTEIRFIGGKRPSIVRRDLMGRLDLQLMQNSPVGFDMII